MDEFNSDPGRRYKVALSAGVACFTPENPIAVNDLLRESDEKMYSHKRRGHTGLKLESA